MNSNRAKNGIFLVLSLIIFLPLLQYKTNAIMSIGLKGYNTRTDTALTWDNWISGAFQKKRSEFINDTFGFRPDFVRLNGQLDYWLFDRLHSVTNSVYVGKDGQLFDQVYVDEYFGWEYLGDSVASLEFYKLRRIQDTLEKLGKTFVFTYGPSKPDYFPDKIPNRLIPKKPLADNNYNLCRRMGDSFKVHQIDFGTWLMNINDTDKNSILARRGTHWTLYAGLLAADSLIKYIERVRNIKLPELKITATHRSDSARESDDDLSQTSDLIFPIKKEPLIYADYKYITDSTRKKVTAIYIGDSFVWSWVASGVLTNINSDWEYWFYFNQVYKAKADTKTPGPIFIPKYDWITPILNTDCVIILFTPFNLRSIKEKHMYVERLYNYFYPAGK